MKPRREMSALANASRDLLNRGDVTGAERVLAPVFNELKADPSVSHLMGMIKQAQRKWDEAEHHFRRAVAETLSEGAYYNDLGVVLQQRGALDEAAKVFRAAIALMPAAAPCRVNLVHCLINAGNLGEAERETRAYIAAIPSAEAWTLMGLVQRNQGRLDDALASAEEALRYLPKVRGLRHNRAIALERVGRTKAAFEAFEQLAREELDSAELAANFARALYQQNRLEEAEAVLAQCLGQWPANTAAQLMLARMRLRRGLGEASTAPLEAAIAQLPDELTLPLLCADFLHRHGYSQRACRILDAALRVAPNAPAFLSALGLVYDELGRSEEGLKLLASADQMVNSPQTQRNLIAPLFRTGRFEAALAILASLRRNAPDDQFLLACETTAQRLTDDGAYRGLCDYERLVRSFEIAPPKGFFTSENFNAALGECLRVQFASAHPLDQSLRNCVQTPRDLRHVGEPNFLEFFAAIDAPVRRYLSTLHPGDEVGRRRTDGYRLRNCAATLLSPGGPIANHVHDGGWISGVYIVEAPPRNGRAGELKFGEPPWALPQCGPQHWVEPRAGTLTLFPSYLWHGVEALGEGGERLSITFDVAPA